MSEVKSQKFQQKNKPYWRFMLLLGAISFVFSLAQFEKFDWLTLLQVMSCVVVLAIAVFFPIQIPKTNISITAGELFLFGASLFIGTPAVIVSVVCIVLFANLFHTFLSKEESAQLVQQKKTEMVEREAQLAALHLQEMQESEERFRSAFDHAAIGMALVTTSGKFLQVNHSFCQLLGYEEAELLAIQANKLSSPEELPRSLNVMKQLLNGIQKVFHEESTLYHKGGQEVWVLISSSLFSESKNHTKCLILQIQDISDRKRAEAQLLHTAFHDSLTGLPNRQLFHDHLKRAMGWAERHPNQFFAVMFLDFDRFKIINDSLGHNAGDELLVTIARRLETVLRPSDIVARLGGDEFTILVEGLTHPEEAILLAERLQTELMAPIQLAGTTEVSTSASIGITFSTIGYHHPEEVIRDADTAMYRAKSLGKACAVVFDAAMHAQVSAQLQLENDLRRAIERQEFFLLYQPVVSLADGKLHGFEAILRWNHPMRGVVSAGEFIRVAEENGMIVPIGRWMIEEACLQMFIWQQLRNNSLPQLQANPLVMSVNLSGRHFAQGDVVDFISKTLRDTGLQPQYLKLEVKESVLVENLEATILTGYSSLSYLHRLPADTIKLDSSFVHRITKNGDNAEIISTIILLADKLEMHVVAEAIESLEQLETLRRLGCEFGQGYLLSRPIDVAAATAIVQQADSWKAFSLPDEHIPEKVFTRVAA
jgi:diguanylate cyclase (GGDEF)-like protein/PAS domain S-box-containing protein